MQLPHNLRQAHTMRGTFLSKPSKRVRDQALVILTSKGLSVDSPRSEKAAILYEWMGQNIKFGFTSAFDEATPDQTLQYRLGHCNPQGALFASLCNAVGVPATQHFVKLTPGVLRGILVPPPTSLLHSYVEITLDNMKQAKMDGYIVDPQLFDNAMKRLKQEKQDEGYGIHVLGTRVWSGQGDSFCQMLTGAQVEQDFGSFDEPQKMYDRWQQLPWFIKPVFGLLVWQINSKIESYRQSP
jgi:hypothetical protein